MSTKLLIAEPTREILPQLAVHVGLNEAIVLQQLHYWTLFTKDPEGWIFNTIEEWREQFPWWSDETIRRAFNSLKSKGLVEMDQRHGNDRVKSYRIDYDKVPDAVPTSQSEDMDATDCEVPGTQPAKLSNKKHEKSAIDPDSKPNPGEWKGWLEHFIAVTGKTATRNGSEEARKLFAGRRAEGRPVEELKLATIGCHSDEHLREQGFDRPETILRPSKVARYVELGRAKAKRRPPGAAGNDANERRKATRRAQGLEDSMADAQIPPQSIEDEEGILSDILDAPVALAAVQKAGLQAEVFYLDRHRHIFRACRRAASEGKQTDEPTVWATLRAMGLGLDDDANPDDDGVPRRYLTALAGKSTNPFGVLVRVERVIAAANLRARLSGAQLLQEGVFEPDDDRRNDFFQRGLALINRDFVIDSEPTSRKELGDDFADYLRNDEPDEVMALPWPSLNECVLGGYRRKQLSVLAGWTGMGKSWLLDQMMHGFKAQGYKAAIFATEMSHRERVARFVTTQTGIALEKLLRKTTSPAELEEAVSVLDTVPFDYFEIAGWSEEEVCERIILGNYDVVAIDVVNLMPGYEEKVAYANRINERFQQVAQRANCHVIVVSHLNRERDKAVVKPRPTKRDLRQTGMLEANAHQILFVHRDQGEDGAKEPGGEAFFDKVRNGMEGSERLYQNQRFLTFQVEARGQFGDEEPVGPSWPATPGKELFA